MDSSGRVALLDVERSDLDEHVVHTRVPGIYIFYTVSSVNVLCQTFPSTGIGLIVYVTALR